MTAYELMLAAQKEADQNKPITTAPAPAPRMRQPMSDLGKAIVQMEQARAAAVQAKMDSAMLERGLLVVFSCPVPGNEKVDRQVTAKVQKTENMGKDSGKWDKTVFPPALHRALESVAGAARRFHYSQTLPWPITGARLLPAANHAAYVAGMADWHRRLDAARDEFLKELPAMREWARKEHNGSFDSSLYEEDRVAGRFGWSIVPQPLPCSDQWVGSLRDILGSDAMTVDGMLQDGMAKAEEDLRERILTPLQSMANALSKAAKGERTKISEALIANLAEISSLVPRLNVNGNAELDVAAADIGKAIDGLTKENLSEDEVRRQKTLDEVNKIMARMKGVIV
jgi:hypothetical protein